MHISSNDTDFKDTNHIISHSSQICSLQSKYRKCNLQCECVGCRIDVPWTNVSHARAN